MQKVNILVILGVLILISLLGFFFWVQKTSAEIGNIQVFSGSAQIISSGKTSDAKTGQGVKVKDSIKVSGGSKVSIILKDSSVIRLDENTEVEVGSLGYKGQKIKDASFKLITGRLWSRVAPLESDGNFDVETPTLVASVRGTSFNTTYSPEISGVYVYKQTVGVALRKDLTKTQSVLQDQLLRMQNEKLDEDFSKVPVTPDPSYFDEWIKFNQEEDNKICRDNPEIPGCENETFSTPSPTPSQTPTPSTSQAIKGAISKPTLSSPKVSPNATPTQTPTATSQQIQTPIPTPTLILSPTPTPVPKKLVKFEITHNNTDNDCYTSCQFSAWAYFDDNPNKAVDVTKNTKWSIESPAHGTITTSGFYTQGQTKGDTIIGSYGSASANHNIPPPYTTPSTFF